MKKINWNAILTVSTICAILFAFTIADLCTKDRVYSETEFRILASKPKLSMKALASGSYMEEYDTYVTDQFVGRDNWIALKTYTDIALMKKEINGVYLGADQYLLEKHDPAKYPQELVEQKLSLLEKLVDRWDAKVMLVPTADTVLADKLPAYAETLDEYAFLEQVSNKFGDHFIDVSVKLQEHNKEYIYYKTDHHWTGLGAYYGYLEYLKAMGLENNVYDTADVEVVTDAFLGTLHSKINVAVAPDQITYFPQTEGNLESIVYDQYKKADSLYEESYLEGKNKYGFFLDDNHALVEIDTNCDNGRTLFVIKDSYANCMIPLLTAHYEKIYVVDLRHMNGKLFPFMESVEPEEGMDVLVLYNCVHFLEDFRYW